MKQLSARLCAALLVGALSAAGSAQELPPAQVAGALMLSHEQLRDFTPLQEPESTTRLGSLVIELREPVSAASHEQVAAPGSVMIRYRNRLVAVATGYRLGAYPTNNGVTIEHWDGNTTCVYTRWELKFTGERLALHDQDTVRLQDCSAR